MKIALWGLSTKLFDRFSEQKGFKSQQRQCKVEHVLEKNQTCISTKKGKFWTQEPDSG